MDEKRLCMLECRMEELKKRLDEQGKLIVELMMALVQEEMKKA